MSVESRFLVLGHCRLEGQVTRSSFRAAVDGMDVVWCDKGRLEGRKSDVEVADDVGLVRSNGMRHGGGIQ